MTKILNSSISYGIVPNEPKLADITPKFKSVESTAWKKYRPISILNSVSKLFEKLVQRKLNPFFDDRLSDHLCGYLKGHSTTYDLLKLIEK